MEWLDILDRALSVANHLATLVIALGLSTFLKKAETANVLLTILC
jgi:hypothetical protein